MDMSKPIVPAPPGYVVNLEHPHQEGRALNLWVGSVGIVLATLFLSMRVYTKAVLAHNFTVDDACMVMAWLFSLAIQGIIFHGLLKPTLGVHIWEMSGENLQLHLNVTTVAAVLYCPLYGFAKFSLLYFYLRLAPMRWFRSCVYGWMFVVIGCNFAIAFPLIFACTPVKKNFDMTITEGHCIDQNALYIATAILNIVTDIVLLVLPLPTILGLQMPRVQKMGLVFFFTIGSLTCITSCVRLSLIFPMMKNPDITFALATPGLWILIEANLLIICGSLPVVRLFLRHVAPRIIGESTMKNSRSGHAGGSKHNGTGSKHGELNELQTIGQLSTRGKLNLHHSNKYGRMVDDSDSFEGRDNDSNSEAHIVVDSGRNVSNGGSVSELHGTHRGGMPATAAGSKHEIITTQTTIVTSEPRTSEFDHEDIARKIRF